MLVEGGLKTRAYTVAVNHEFLSLPPIPTKPGCAGG